ncbi:MAG: hypothetical protein WDN28_31565 [Chthoniobacter sp.]
MRAAFRAHSENAPDPAELIEFVPADYFARANMNDMFPRPAPLEIDLGCGEGAFLVAMAAKYPERNFLGIERLLGRVRKVCRMVVHHQLTNTRLLRIETAYALRYVLSPETVSVAHVLFPDPWPKRHHQPRRLIQTASWKRCTGSSCRAANSGSRRTTSRISSGWRKCSREPKATSGSIGRRPGISADEFRAPLPRARAAGLPGAVAEGVTAVVAGLSEPGGQDPKRTRWLVCGVDPSFELESRSDAMPVSQGFQALVPSVQRARRGATFALPSLRQTPLRDPGDRAQ